MSPLIKLTSIKKDYMIGQSQLSVLKNVSLSVEQGDFISLVGASGSGKTTLLNIIGCLDQASSGEYLFETINLSQANDKKRSSFRSHTLGFVFQQFNLIPHYTALNNVALALTYQGISKSERESRALCLLEKVGLKDRATHTPSELSGGERQRVSIARALVTNPKVILADEPTGNLDSATSQSIIALLKTIHNEGKTIILVTHDMGVAKQAKRTIYMKDGLIVEDSK
ncbi:MAG: macrolide ABC transporter ATP-binding protein [Actinobacteria bacterium]|nr:macrolide ABC transporter ATP-binding protein [Actinomycetota bacterium]|tara:strand:- start:919 stop:1599 length:681 start_codon:yes stop_codon:yes gene_type:complete